MKITRSVAFEFFHQFLPIENDLSGNTVEASGFQNGIFSNTVIFFFIQIDKVSLLCSFDYAFRENCLDNVQSSNKLNFLTLADLDSLLDSKALDKTTPKRWQRKFFLEKNPS